MKKNLLSGTFYKMATCAILLFCNYFVNAQITILSQTHSAASTTSGTNLITNGSFETGAATAQIQLSPTDASKKWYSVWNSCGSLPGWTNNLSTDAYGTYGPLTISGGTVVIPNTNACTLKYAEGGPPFAATSETNVTAVAHGNNLLYFGIGEDWVTNAPAPVFNNTSGEIFPQGPQTITMGTNPIYITQSVSVTNGTTYCLEFWATGEGEGYPKDGFFRLDVGTTTLWYTIPGVALDHFNTNYRWFQIKFTANSTTNLPIKFTSYGHPEGSLAANNAGWNTWLGGQNGTELQLDAVSLVACSPVAAVSVSGNVFNDPNAGNVNNSSGATNTVPTGMTAYLIQGGLVVGTATVATDGTFSFPNVTPATGYTVEISTTAASIGSAAPVVTLPSGWNSTGEFNGTPNTGNDGTANGISASFTVGSANVVDINFGIQQGPETAINVQPNQVNPGGTTSVTVPTAAFQTSTGGNPNTDDPTTGGTVTSINIPTFPTNATSITVNGITYLASNPIWGTGGITIPYTDGVGPNQTVTVDPLDGATDVVIPIVAIDNAGVKDPSAGSITLPFTAPLTLAGTIYHDITGLTDAIVTDGTGLGNPSSTPLYANLLSADGTTVVATVLVNNDGTYSLPVSANTTYIVQVSTNQGTVGQPTPATALPTGWVNTGDVNPTDPTATAATPGLSAPVEVVASNVVNVDFGIQQPPTAVDGTTAAVPNPGGTIQSADAASLFSGTDPTTNTVTAVNITAFPTDATTIIIGGTTFTNLTGIQAAYPNGIPTNPDGSLTVPITVDPISTGVTSVIIPFTVTDAAGAISTNIANVTIPFSNALPVDIVSFIGKQVEDQINITWKTANESAFSHFEIQHSENAKEFGSIGNVLANNLGHYNLIDNSPNEGINYYRLKMVDQDGSFTLSKSISVVFEKGANFISVENPATNGEFKVLTSLASPKFLLMNSLGTPVGISINENGMNNYLIKTKAVPGVYYLNVISNKFNKTSKVIIP